MPDQILEWNGSELQWDGVDLLWGDLPPVRSAPILHSPADVTAQVLIDVLGEATDPTADPLQPWPVFPTSEPSDPDDCITVTDTTPVDQGRAHPGGERLRHFGIQVRVRATDHRTGWLKAEQIRRRLDEEVYAAVVTLDGTSYLVHCYSRTNGPLTLGRDTPSTKRSLFAVNATLALRRLT